MKRKRFWPFMIDIAIVFLNGAKQIIKESGGKERWKSDGSKK